MHPYNFIILTNIYKCKLLHEKYFYEIENLNNRPLTYQNEVLYLKGGPVYYSDTHFFARTLTQIIVELKCFTFSLYSF